MQIIHIPGRFIGKSYTDPREQDVRLDPPLTPESEQAAQIACSAERATAPPHLKALRGELPAGHCSACGEATAYHFDTSGFHWIGCAGVPARKHLQMLIARPLTFATEWSDVWPTVSAAVRDALLAGCGEAVSDFYESLTVQEKLDLSRRLAEIAVVAFKAQERK